MSGEDKQAVGGKAQVVESFARHVNRGQMRYLRSGHLDVLESQRQGIRFVDPFSGREYVDCFTSAGCFNVGRHNPEVLAALEAATRELDVGTYALVSPLRVQLARRLTSLAPGDQLRPSRSWRESTSAGASGNRSHCAQVRR